MPWEGYIQIKLDDDETRLLDAIARREETSRLEVAREMILGKLG